MATETTFKSSRSTGARGLRMDARRVFEDGGGGATATSGGATSRYHRSDRTESPSSGARTTSSITNKINKLSLRDDKGDEHEHDEHEKDEGREEEQTSSASSRRLPKKDGHRSRVEDDGDKEGEPEEDQAPSARKQIKKSGTANTGKKRKEKKNLREKRRSTGVVIMPGQPANLDDEDAKTVARNTAANMDESAGAGAAAAGDYQGYQDTISQLQEELAARHKELDSLKSQVDTLTKQNLRLKDENSALLRVVGSLSGTGGGR